MDDQANEFTRKVDITIKNGFETLLLAVGSKLKIFDYLGTEETPRTSMEIADMAHLKERYVREWLNGMVVAKFVECDPSGQKYWMNTVAKESLTSRSVQIAFGLTRCWTYMIKLFDEICTCFQPNGMPYSAYGDIHRAIGDVTSQWRGPHFIQHVIPSILGLKEKLANGITCLDIGCGVGTLPLLLAAHFPRSQFFAVDFVSYVIEDNVKRAREKGLSNVHFLVADSEQLPKEWTAKFEYVTAYDSVHEFPRADLALKEIVRVLKPGGQFSQFDVNASSNVYENIHDDSASTFYAISLFHCMPCALYPQDGLGLGTMVGREKTMELLKGAGFVNVQVIFDQSIEKHNANAHYLCLKNHAD